MSSVAPPIPTPRRRRMSTAALSKAGGAALLAILASGCAVKPEAITPGQHVGRAQEDYKKIFKNDALPTHPLSLAEVLARALKFNYDAELDRQQTTLQDRQFDLALAGMLPRLALNAGYNARTNDPAAQSINERTRQVSLDYAFSEEPQHFTAGPEFTWTVLDLGLSYLQAKQQGYQAYIAVERRRRTIADIVKRVQESYWNAAVAGQMLPRIRPLLARAEKVLAASQEVNRRQLAPDRPMLEFQREMMTVVGQLRRVENDLNNANAQLSTLISVPNTATLSLSEAKWELAAPPKSVDSRKLEELGLALRPELREEAYQEKVDRHDVYKEIMKMVPGVGILANFNYDSNKYLYNNTWGAVGVQASFNLANIIRGPRAIAMARQTVEVTKTRRLALSVAILSQVNLSFQQYRNAADDMRTARDVFEVERRIGRASAAASAADSLSDAERMRQELALALSELNYYHSVIKTRSSLVNLYISCGVDLVPPSLDIDDLDKATEGVGRTIGPWVAGRPPEVVLPEPVIPTES
jgi:outer membrane protein TolC